MMSFAMGRRLLIASHLLLLAALACAGLAHADGLGALSGIPRGQLPGTATNDNAAAGNIGEFITASATAVSMTSNAANNITSITLTAGDWEVWGQASFIAGATTTVSQLGIGTTTASATFPGYDDPSENIQALTFTTGGRTSLPAGLKRYSVNANTTVFLVGNPNFATSTMTADGQIFARRRR